MLENYMDDVLQASMSEDELKNRTKLVSSLTSTIVSKAIRANQSDKDLIISNEIGQSNVENNSLKLITTTIKIARKLKKIDGKITKDKLKDIGLEEVADIVEDGSTIIDPNASIAEKAMAIADIVIGTEFNSKKTKVASNSDKEYGSYTNLHESGKKYHGQGNKQRSQKSGKEKEIKYDDPHVATDWTPASNRRDTMKDESIRIEKDGGIQNPNNYNKINSPGARYKIEDGE